MSKIWFEKKEKEKFEEMGKRISRVSQILQTIAVIIAIIGGFYIVGLHIDSRIKHIVNDEQFIKKVSSHVRPFVIFDENETIYVEGGAMQYLEKIEVEQTVGEKGDLQSLKIIITPRSHLVYAPLLEIHSLITFYVTNRRGIGHQWVYELTPLFEVSGPNTTEVHRFRLEILR